MTTTATHRNTQPGTRLHVSYRKYGHLQSATLTVTGWTAQTLTGTTDAECTVRISTDRIEYAEAAE